MALSDVKLRSLQPAAKPYKLSDSGGLHVLVNTNGSRLWRLAYRFQGKQKLLALGAYPEISLREARDARDRARDQLDGGEDPSALRRAEKRRALEAAENTFKSVADEWFEKKKAAWAESYASRLRARLDDDLLPALGKRPISQIEPAEVLDAVRLVERRGAVEMAHRIMQMASSIFRYGVATSRCQRDPTADLRGALQTPKEPKRRAALKASDLNEFQQKLDAYDGEELTRLALRVVLLTFVRTEELRFARWEEFEDLEGDAPLWRVPAKRMKMKRPHLVPLAPQAVEVLAKVRELSRSSEYLFPAATRSKVISENTMLYALYRMGYRSRATVHGFRSTASTVLNEAQFNPDWIEMQLAHVEGGVRAVYNAAEWLPGRREMMKWWADFLDQQVT